MRISRVELERTPQADELSGLVGDYRLWYRFAPGTVGAASADSFLAAALLPAMARGESLELDPELAVSPKLLAGTEPLQEIFATWLPQLKRISVSARTALPAAAKEGVACFFSGGVDSLYSYLRHEDEISHLIQIHGYDYRRENRSLAEEAERANLRFAEPRAKRLVVVESNFRELFEQHRIHIYVYHGAILASIALALGLRKVYVPGTFTWASLKPCGTHPVCDPLWSNESGALVRDGAEARRVDKIRRICEDQVALDLLRVCPRNNTYSCGQCEKCLRTRVCLRVLGLRSAQFAPLESTAPIYRIALVSAWWREIWAENLEAAKAAGDRRLARAIAFVLARYDVRRVLLSLDLVLFGGWVRRQWIRLRRSLSRKVLGPPILRLDNED